MCASERCSSYHDAQPSIAHTCKKMGSILFFSAPRHYEIKEVSRSNPGGESVGRKIELTPEYSFD